MIPRKRLLFFAPVCVAAVGAMWPADAAAQHRVLRRAPVRTVIVAGYSHPFSPFYYDPFWSGWYGYQYRPYPPYPPYYYYQPGADLRIQVKPREAEVYIDGYLVGNVDDYDGVFQRLRVPFGEHEISVYREGFRTITEKMLFRPYQSYNIKQTMQPLAAGEAAEARPEPDPSRAAPEPRGAGPEPRRAGPPEPGNVPEAPPRRPGPPDGRPGDRNADRFGSLAVRVQPDDAVVYIDGERWDRSGGEDRLVIELAEGQHRVEVRKEGFKTYSSTVRVRGGERATLNVSLAGE